MLPSFYSKWKSLLDRTHLVNKSTPSVLPLSRALNNSTSIAPSFVEPTVGGDDGAQRGFQLFGILAGGLAFGAGISITLFDGQHAHCEEITVVDDQLQSIPTGGFRGRLLQFSEGIRRRIFFLYERRIRAYSSPEKVFAYFSSIKGSKGQYFMTPGDLMRAFIPVLPPSEGTIVRGGYLVGERIPGELHCAPSSFFMMFDTNEDGRISFEEYNFFRTLIVTSLESFVAAFKMFDRNGDGTIDMKEFIKVLQVMRERMEEAFGHHGKHLNWRSLDSVANIGLLKYLFGENGERVLRYENFVDFLKQLHYELLCLEFAHYDVRQQGSIPAQDFGCSMVASASMSKVNKYLKRVDALADEPSFNGVRISFQDFKQFSKLRRKRKLLALSAYAVDGAKGFSKQDFQWAASQVCQVHLSDEAVDVIFYIFDSNGDGKLSLGEFLGVQDLRDLGPSDPLQPGIVHFVRCLWKCSKNKCNFG